MDSRPPFLDWLQLVAAAAACTCERVSTSQHDPDHATSSADPSAEQPAPPKPVRRVRLISCSPALHAVGE